MRLFSTSSRACWAASTTRWPSRTSGSVSPLHKDSPDNFVIQMVGTKRLLLFSPMDMDKMGLVPRSGDSGKTGTSLNFSKHGAFTPEEFMHDLRKKFPALRDVRMFVVDLKPGELLYLPSGWGHCVHNLGHSVMLNFWLQLKSPGGIVRIWDL